MKEIFKFFFFILFFGLYGNNTLSAEETNTLSYIKLGKLEPFWRNQPVIGRWLSRGHGLIKVPDYLQDTSFPYQLRPYKKEVPFSDSLTVVRLLGGWDYRKKRGELNGQKEADLVYIKKGKLYYRWELLAKRLDPYIDAGYTSLTLVLDNIPWAFPKKAKIAKYGQVAPPYDLKKWETFLDAMLHELVRIYGYDTVKHFRFRLGTEWQAKHRFSGTNKNFTDLYFSTYKIIKKILPNAKFGPFNHGGGKGQLKKNNINMANFIRQITNKNNTICPQIDFLPISSYYIVKKQHNNHMRKILDKKIKMDNNYIKELSTYTDRNFSKEIHEFGLLNYNAQGIRSNEPGVRGAAWEMYILQNMLENNISKLYHWHTVDKVTKNKYLLQGNGWNYTILDHLVGGEVVSLETVSKDSIHYKTLLVRKNEKVYIVTTIFPDVSNIKKQKTISLSIPKELISSFDTKGIQWTFLSPSTSVHDIIHDDFLKEGLLNNAFLKDLSVIGRIKQMGNKSGIRQIIKKWEIYKKIVIESLTLKPYTEDVNIHKDSLEFIYNIKIPAVSVIILNLKNSEI